MDPKRASVFLWFQMPHVISVANLFPGFKFKKFHQPPGTFIKKLHIFVPGWHAGKLSFLHLQPSFLIVSPILVIPVKFFGPRKKSL